eukprot:2365900-Karenia_brevis.AAC.1
MVCKEKALNKVVNASQNEGLEAWRQLCLLFESRIRARYAGLLAEVLSLKMTGDVGERLEAWERLVLRWQAQSKETLSDNLRIGIVLMQLEE